MRVRSLFIALPASLPFTATVEAGTMTSRGPNWIAIGMFLVNAILLAMRWTRSGPQSG